MSEILVLCYHGISERWPAELAVHPESLERQLQHVLGRGYVGATFSQAVSEPPGRRTFAVTFDDGYRSVHELAFPLLRRLGLPGTVFVPTEQVGTGEPMSWAGIEGWLPTEHRSELVGMSWAELGRLHAAGWEIGSHTRTHPSLTEIDDAELARELGGSKEALEQRLGAPCDSLAYPYGDFDERVVEATRRAGYQAAAGLLPGAYRRHGRLKWPRVMVMRSDTDRRYRRQVSHLLRAGQEVPAAWHQVEKGVGLARRTQDAVRARFGSPGPVARPPASASRGALRLVARRGRLELRRPRVLMAGLAARAGIIEAYALWPDEEAPLVIAPASGRYAAAWLRRTFEREGRGRLVDAATWNALRARALLVSTERGIALEVTERALERPLTGARVACYSPVGASLSKVICFVFEPDERRPVAVVRAMSDPAGSARLRREVEMVERLREELDGHERVARALPVRPLAAEGVNGQYTVVEPVDEMAEFTGRDARTVALEWLAEFQAGTTSSEESWGEPDERSALDAIGYAWGRTDPTSRDALAARWRELSADLRGAPVPHCVVHGDFWRGNLAAAGHNLRVYDWEWAEAGGRPFFDLWTYELAELREQAGAGLRDLLTPLEEALGRVEGQLERRELPRAFAAATLAPAIAHFTFRIRRSTGRAGGHEANSIRVMGAAERLLLGDRGP